MNTKHRADRLLDVWLQLEAPASPPPELLTDITARTSSTRPRPAWLARLEGHHMDVIQGGRRTGAPRLGLVLAIIGLLLLAIAAAAFFGSRPQNLVVSPPTIQPSPGASLSAAATQSTAQTPRPTVRPFVRDIQPGDRVPDEVIGEWWDPSFGEFVYYLRAGDPYCVAQYQITQQDCLVYQDSHGRTSFQQHADVVTVVDGQLRYFSLPRQNCEGRTSLATWKRVGDQLQLQVVDPGIGSCFTGLSSPLYRVGSPGAPASARPLPSP